MDNFTRSIYSALEEVSGFNVAEIQDESILTADLNLDSLDLVNLAVDLEDRLDCEIPDSLIRGNMTVQELVESLKNIQGGATV